MYEHAPSLAPGSAPSDPNRRAFLSGVCGVAATLLSGAAFAQSSGASPIRDAAATQKHWRVPYGAAVRTGVLLQVDQRYRDAILRDCRLVVPEGALNWSDVRPQRSTFVFEDADRITRFALANGIEPRGHPLVWHGGLPDWTTEIKDNEAEGVLREHIEAVVGRFKGVITSWDAVNEPIAEHASNPDDLRKGLWLSHLGPRYMDIALRTAASVDPKAKLLVNEYDVEFATDASRMKRSALLKLLQDLKSRNVPLHGVGLQGHLLGRARIDTDGLAAFTEAVHGLGLGVYVTELDVIDNEITGTVEEIDAAVAAQVDAFLAGVFAHRPPASIVTWGITDRHSWVPMYFKRADGLTNRALPLDEDYREKPFMQVIERYCA